MNEAIYQQHLQLIRTRWPRIADALERDHASIEIGVEPRGVQTLIVNGLHLGSCYDPDAEAAVQARLVPESSPQAWCYGVGTGALPRHLLRRQTLECLHIVVLNGTVLRQSLGHFNHQDWLSDKRVDLQMADESHNMEMPFAAVPACLKLAQDAAARLRDQILLELSTPYINQRFLANERYVKQVSENRQLVEQDGDVCELYDRCANRTVHVAGAGPSLAEQYEQLRTRSRDELLIAVDAALTPLLQNSIIPDIVVTVDGMRDNILAYFDLDMAALTNNRLVYFPVVHRDVLQRWPGMRLAAYSSSPLYQDIRRELPRGELFSSGSVIHSAVDLAVKMGASSIKLYGADFSFPDLVTHAPGAAFTRRIQKNSLQVWVLNAMGERVPTNPNMRGYLRDLEHYIAAHPQVLFINTGQRGAKITGAVNVGDS